MWNSNIADLYGVGDKAGDYGVEIEVEGHRLPMEVQGWRVERDGSLRGEALEYVFNRPVKLNTAATYIRNLRQALNANEGRVNDSVRAGIHIHKNVTAWTARQLYVFLTAYYVMEEVLVDLCGEGRRGNLFCLRAKDAEFIVDILMGASQHNDVTLIGGDNIRYAALNLNALSKHGSIEFRAIRTTPDFDERVTWWLGLFDTFSRNVLANFNTPREVVEIMSAGGEDGFVDLLFEDYAPDIKAVDHYGRKMMEGVRIAQDVAYTVNI